MLIARIHARVRATRLDEELKKNPELQKTIKELKEGAGFRSFGVGGAVLRAS
mgnify:CR=1 FL=1